MQIPILNGITTDTAGDFRRSYPVNMVPVPVDQGISQGYIRPGSGIVESGTGPGVDRGGYNWNDVCFRVMGTKLVSIDEFGVVTEIGDIPGSDLVKFTQDFNRIAIAADNRLFFYDGTIIEENTDPDLGRVVDVEWQGGYFMTTDGENLVVTELNDHLAVDPFKYGSSEADPDPVVGLLRLRNEIYAFNRYTAELFQNVGGTGFPFQRIVGAQLQRGAVGRDAIAIFLERIAFIGSGRNEKPRVYLGSSGNTAPISTREIEDLITQYTEEVLSKVKRESRIDRAHQFLWIHLPNQTLVYDAAASSVAQEPIWHILTSTKEGFSQYRAKNLVWCYNKWLVGDPASARHGYLDDSLSAHWAETIYWQFDTIMMYNESRGALIHSLELVGLPGRSAFGEEPTVSTQFTLDGLKWSQRRTISAGSRGDTLKRMQWLAQGEFRNYRSQRFNGTSDTFVSFARLQARVEPLLW